MCQGPFTKHLNTAACPSFNITFTPMRTLLCPGDNITYTCAFMRFQVPLLSSHSGQNCASMQCSNLGAPANTIQLTQTSSGSLNTSCGNLSAVMTNISGTCYTSVLTILTPQYFNGTTVTCRDGITGTLIGSDTLNIQLACKYASFMPSMSAAGPCTAVVGSPLVQLLVCQSMSPLWCPSLRECWWLMFLACCC